MQFNAGQIKRCLINQTLQGKHYGGNSAAGETPEKPVFRMQKMYIKDLSFENPNAPEVFTMKHKSEPNVELNLQLNNRKMMIIGK